MTHQGSKYSDLGNMSKAEGILRGVVGMAVIEAMLVIPSLSEMTLAVLVSISIYIVMSAIMRWDPLYALLGSLGRQASSTALTVTPLPKPQSKPESVVEHKKAA
jgi:hypothetical protein